MYLKDYERKQLVERGVMAGVSDSEGDEEDSQGKEVKRISYIIVTSITRHITRVQLYQ